ncbi:MAG: STAS-like domain-containing protein [Terracidiphilus sp.]
MAITLSVAKDFSETPGPRSREEGEFSGDEFRDNFLKPAFVQARDSRQRLVVDLDGVVGYATSFLEAAFGGLAREFGPCAVLETVELVCSDEPSLVEEVKRYIEDAKKEEAGEWVR